MPAPPPTQPAPPVPTPASPSYPQPPVGHAQAGYPSAPPGTGRAAAPTFRSWQPGILPLRPVSFGDFLVVPFRAMRYNRAVVLGAPLLASLAMALSASVALWLLFTEPFWATLDTVGTGAAFTIRTETIVMGAVTLLLSLLCEMFATALVAPGLARAVMGERISLGQAWEAARPRIGALALLWLLTSGALLLVVAAITVPYFVAVANGDLGTGIALYLALLAVSVVGGFAVAMIGGIARAVVVLEARGAVAAIRRVIHLLKGRFWWTVLILVVGIVLISFVVGILQQVGALGGVVAFAIAPQSATIATIAFLLIVAISLTVGTAVSYAYLGSLYPLLLIDLRIRHEGFDLTLAEAAEARHRP